MSTSLKPIEWVGRSLEDLKEFPEDVRQMMGYASIAYNSLRHQPQKMACCVLALLAVTYIS